MREDLRGTLLPPRFSTGSSRCGPSAPRAAGSTSPGPSGSATGSSAATAPPRPRRSAGARSAVHRDRLHRAVGLRLRLRSRPEAGPATSPPAIPAGLASGLDFDRFVIGDGNRFAHAAALAVAEAPSEAYNPLFLHGPPGLGKTHLLVAIANYLRGRRPGLSVRYTTAERFTNEFVARPARRGRRRGFKARYRDLDVLLIDDVQFLEGKRDTEEEFFHTFNALYDQGSQLVLSADRIPERALDPRERACATASSGASPSAVEPPNLATRLTVLRRLVREAGIAIADGDVAPPELADRIDATCASCTAP